MKTSNKLLLAAFGLILAGTIIIIIKVKSIVSSNISDYQNKRVELSGLFEEKAYEITTFKKLKVEGAVSLNLAKGRSGTLIIKADTSVLKYVQVDQNDDQLVVKLVNMRNKKARIHAELTVPEMNLEKLTANAGAKLEIKDTIISKNVDIEVNAGGHGRFLLSCKEVDCGANAGGFATLIGNTVNFRGRATAGAHIKGKGLHAESAKVNAVAGGQINICVSSELDANCTAGGTVRYNGNPEKKNINTSAGGRVAKD